MKHKFKVGMKVRANPIGESAIGPEDRAEEYNLKLKKTYKITKIEKCDYMDTSNNCEGCPGYIEISDKNGVICEADCFGYRDWFGLVPANVGDYELDEILGLV